MLKTRVIPSMLFDGSHLVKTIRFGERRNLGSPLQAARVYNSRDVDELVFLDMMATREHRTIDPDIVHDVLNECFMPLTVGGGIRTLEDIEMLLKIGADKVSINTAATPELMRPAAERFGNQCIVVSLDVHAGEHDHATLRARQAQEQGAGEIFLTSIDHDGVMEGYDTELIKAVSSAVSIPVIASGGAGKPHDAVEAVRAGAHAVSMASMFHYTEYTPHDVKSALASVGIPVRIQ